MDEKRLLYWQASPHQWGPGKIHLVASEEQSKTLCGKALEKCPGRWVSSQTVGVGSSCHGCSNALEARIKRERDEAQWKERQLAFDLRRQDEAQARRERYQEYLQSEKWARKRDAVLKRENYVCEACRKRRASQVHHSTYRHIFDEPLFELHAICAECHEKLSALDQARRGQIGDQLCPS